MKRYLIMLAAALDWHPAEMHLPTTPRLTPVPPNPTDTADRLVHPEWSRNATIYEMNLRQHSAKEDLKSATADLARIHQLGSGHCLAHARASDWGGQSKRGRKQGQLPRPASSSSLGSPYSVQDYKALNPDYGSWADLTLSWRRHDYGMKVIIDWVANHTAFDAVWTQDTLSLKYFLLDSLGALQPPTGTDWVDVAQLDWDNGVENGLYDAMEDALLFWVQDHDIDGFRCDVAGKVPTAFWERARRALEEVEPEVFMLAEAEVPEHHNRAFDASYAWEFHHITNEVAKGHMNADSVRAYLDREAERFSDSAYRMTFITNHDENSWNGTVRERYGDAGRAMAVLCGTVMGMPLIYGGQESEMDKRLRFFEKDTVPWGDYRAMSFYRILNDLHHRHTPLYNGEFGAKAVPACGGRRRAVLRTERRRSSCAGGHQPEQRSGGLHPGRLGRVPHDVQPPIARTHHLGSLELRGVRPVSMKSIALVAHDGKKDELVAFAQRWQQFFSKVPIIATETTGTRLAEKGIQVETVASGPKGGTPRLRRASPKVKWLASSFFETPWASIPMSRTSTCC